MGASRNLAWSFRGPCRHCRGTREFLVNEVPGDEVVWARCRKCTVLVPVPDTQRMFGKRSSAACLEKG